MCRYRDLLIVPVSSCPCDTRLLGLECHSMDVRTPVTAPASPGTASGTPGPPSQGRQCPGAWCQTRTGHPNTHFRFEVTFVRDYCSKRHYTISTLKQSETSAEEASVESPRRRSKKTRMKLTETMFLCWLVTVAKSKTMKSVIKCTEPQ